MTRVSPPRCASLVGAGRVSGRLRGCRDPEELADEDELELGQRVRIVPNHACVVVNLFDALHVTRNEALETSWRVVARGRSQ